MSEPNESKKPRSRREFVRKAAYIGPAILTLPAAPSFANSGSRSYGTWGEAKKSEEKKGSRKRRK
jgi:hypothetical protein